MRFRRRLAPVLLLATLSTVAVALSLDDSPASIARRSGDDIAQVDQNSEATFSSKDIGTKDAPVDGLDGKPHAGPFVESGQRKKYPPIAEDLGTGRPDPAAPPGKSDASKYGSESVKNLAGDVVREDSVMNDESRAKPKKGTTGTEGGVSERTQLQEKKEQEGKGDVKMPGKPKEAPSAAGDKVVLDETPSGKVPKKGEKGYKDVSGLEVCGSCAAIALIGGQWTLGSVSYRDNHRSLPIYLINLTIFLILLLRIPRLTPRIPNLQRPSIPSTPTRKMRHLESSSHSTHLFFPTQ
jgi:hypothetical protein